MSDPRIKDPAALIGRTADELLRYASLHGYTGEAIIRVSFNQGGATGAKPQLIQPVVEKPSH